METDDLIFEFVTESRELLSTIEDELLEMERTKDALKQELISKVFRAAHTVKGTTGFFGLKKINDLSHAMETLLSMIRDGEIKAESKYVDALLVGVDNLNTMLDDVQNSNQFEIGETLVRLNALISGESIETAADLKTSVSLEVGDPKDAAGGTVEVDTLSLKQLLKKGEHLYALTYDLNEFMRASGVSPLELVNELLQLGSIVEGRAFTPLTSLKQDLRQSPLLYRVIFSTVIDPSLIAEATQLPPERIVVIKDEKILEKLRAEPPQALMTEDGGGPSPAVPPDDVDRAGEPARAAAPRPPAAAPKPVVPPAAAAAARKAEPPPAPAASPAAPPPPPVVEPREKAAPPPSAKAEPKEEPADREAATIRLRVELLEELMRLTGELVLVRNQQLLAAELDDSPLKSAAQRLNAVTSELQDVVMRTRLQPIGNVLSKFPRLVRDLSKKLGKDIELTMTGEDVELDKTIIESLGAPLTHMIRNCCDHAIGLPDERVAAGKPPKGVVSIKAYHMGGHIAVEVRDDGKGIDSEAVRRKALEKGLKTEAELAKMSEKELQSLIMLPGFSTAKTVSDVSGRGVGMDVVKSSVDKLGGSLDFESRKGAGTRFLLRLPLTVAIIPSLIVESGGERFAIPQVNVEEIVRLYDCDALEKIETAGGVEVYRLRDRLLPLVRLAEVLARPAPFDSATRAAVAGRHAQEREKIKGELSMLKAFQDDKSAGKLLSSSIAFAVVKYGQWKYGLGIDRVVGAEDIVAKPMHAALKELPCYAGATVMGDGKVALILNTDSVAVHGGLSLISETGDKAKATAVEAGHGEAYGVLVFKSGPDERFAIPLPFIKRIAGVERSRFEKVGGRDFIAIDGTPTRALSMDAALRVSPLDPSRSELFLILPKHAARPFGLLASELLDIVEAPPRGDDSSHAEDGYLGSVLIDGRLTLIPDLYRLLDKAEPEHAAPAAAPAARRRILLAEDAKLFQRLLKGYLETDGYDVEVAVNGQQALEQFQRHDFDLIISDIEMPKMNGFDLVRAVRSGSRHPDIPAIAVTTLSSPEDKAKGKAAGFTEYSVKIDRERLLSSVGSLLGRRG